MEDRIYATTVKQTLLNAIDTIDDNKWFFVKNPEKNFTRNRKISFKEVINMCLQLEGGSLQNEMLKYFDFSYDTPTKSAYCQQRAKVYPQALKCLFFLFTEDVMALGDMKTFHGYRLLAGDGSDVNIPYNPEDTETFHKAKGKRGYNQLHLNAFYDILNGIYPDVVLEPDRKSHERCAFNTMIDRHPKDSKSIIMGDRGYEGYNLFAHIMEAGQKFIIRLKDEDSNGILSTHDFSEYYDENGEFDREIDFILTWKQTNEIKQQKQYVYCSRKKFDFYDENNPFYAMKLRIVCIEVAPGKYEYLATNLDREEFPLGLLKEAYHLRWDEETSFRSLKYTIDLLHFHAKKREFIEQEAWAKLIVYNFCEAITRHVAVTKQSKQGRRRKHDQKINFATATSICKAFMKRSDGEIEPCRLIRRFLIPVRQGRSYPRNIKPQSAKMFLYRAS